MNIETVSLYIDGAALSTGCYIWLVKVSGSRNSFMCGKVPDFPPVSDKIEIPIKGGAYKIMAQGNYSEPDKTQIETIKKAGVVIEKYLR